jgi:hypothetical protein
MSDVTSSLAGLGSILGPSLMQTLANTPNAQGNNATAPDPFMVLDATQKAQTFPQSVIGAQQSKPDLMSNPFKGQSTTAQPSPQNATAQPAPTQTTPFNPAAMQSRIPQMQDPIQEPNLNMSPDETANYQALMQARDKFMQQAQAQRLATAQQQMPQQNHLTLLSALPALLASAFQKSGHVDPGMAYINAFQQAAQQNQQQNLMNYQQQQNAGNVQAQNLEESANTKGAQAGATLAQHQKVMDDLVKLYQAGVGYQGKVNVATIGAQAKEDIAQAQNFIRQHASDNRLVGVQDAGLLKILQNNLATPESKGMAIAALQQAHPDTWGQMNPGAVSAAVNSISPAYTQALSKSAEIDALGQKYHSQALTEDQLRDPKIQQTLARTHQIVSNAGLDDAKANMIATRVQYVPMEMKAKMATMGANAALAQARANQVIQSGGNPTREFNNIQNALASQSNILKQSIASIEAQNGKRPPDPTSPQYDQYQGLQNRLADIQNDMDSVTDKMAAATNIQRSKDKRNNPQASVTGGITGAVLGGNGLTGVIGAPDGSQAVPDIQPSRGAIQHGANPPAPPQTPANNNAALAQQYKAAANRAIAQGADRNMVMQRLTLHLRKLGVQ